MQKEQILEKLETLYQDKKSQNFVLHLIRSYLPLNKSTKVWGKPENLKKFKCALTDTKLISVEEILSYVYSNESFEKFRDNLKNISAGIQNNQPIPTDLFGFGEHLKGRVLGYQGEKTTTYLSEEALICLYDFTATKILKGDGKMNWTMRQMQANSFVKQFAKPKVKKKPETQYSNRPATSSLGDNDALQKLKDKLNNGAK